MISLLPPVRAVLRRMPSVVPARQRRVDGSMAAVDGIDYILPVNSEPSPVLMAAFPVDAPSAAALLPGAELHPVRLPGGKGILMVTVINYLATDIGAYIEYSLAIAVTRGARPAPPLLPLLLQKSLDFGQYVVDLPVSTEVSVKGGKGIWGMPKHQASLDFRVTDATVSSAYEIDGVQGALVEMDRPPATALPVKIRAVNFCTFRGMLYQSTIYFAGTADVAFGRAARARLDFGPLPQVAGLAGLAGAEALGQPLFTVYIPDSHGVLDDHVESWFQYGHGRVPDGGDGLDSVAHLGRGEGWPDPPRRDGRWAGRPVPR
ncbi:acetoacetate decarboxylase family protein [Microbacterium sp. A93]|uniref:acetoacetate decarboxylase family protein n=1 Tax=Microbacterium sp. A93 TaxID=3450716 RepID=UPI003F43CD9D